MGNKGTRHKTW